MQNEQHPLLPSGDWEGFYVYNTDGAKKHNMKLNLHFQKQAMKGSGTDDVGAFTIQGSYNTDSLTCQFQKIYSQYKVDYSGEIDENGIWGTWKLRGKQGGFHIWPKSDSNVEKEEQTQKETIETQKAVPVPKRKKQSPSKQ